MLSWPAWLQADPGLAERDASLVAEFEAAPWLLPPRTKALSYAGVHNLDELATLRATSQGNLTKTVSLLTFSKRVAVMTQNTSEWPHRPRMPRCRGPDHLLCARPATPLYVYSRASSSGCSGAAAAAPSYPAPPVRAVYSMVKFGGVRNYIVGTWSPGDLEACADLNLPCADIGAFLAEPMDAAFGSLSTHDYNVSRLDLPCLLSTGL